ncbi:uncharacterized protein LOC108252420 [Diaphorina citri]|uniref:Uncharacterized protein LOC108252420 n=1 Tax=Diaphorina citri TaxID=121845 RepID=A0A1S4EBR3_DIACI|nr:uncharacterized protein LOC108252420 [Diaphorina citri]
MNYIHVSWKRLWWTLVVILCGVVTFPRRVDLKPINAASHVLGLDEHDIRKIQYIPQYHCLRYRKLDLIKRCRNSLYNDITKKLRKSFTSAGEPVDGGNRRGVW